MATQGTLTLRDPAWIPDYLTVNKMTFSGRKIWEPKYSVCSKNRLKKNDLFLAQDNSTRSSRTPTSYQTHYGTELLSEKSLQLKWTESKETFAHLRRINKSSRVDSLLKIEDPECRVLPTYWTEYKIVHSKLGFALGSGVERMPPKNQNYHILTGEKLPERTDQFHLTSRSRLLLRDRQLQQKECTLLQ